MTFEIQKGIPVTETRGTPRRYPWGEMEVGDSFFVPGMTTSNFGGRRTDAERRHGIKIATRKEGDGVRVWRVR